MKKRLVLEASCDAAYTKIFWKFLAGKGPEVAGAEEDGALLVSGPNSNILLETDSDGNQSPAAIDALSGIKEAVTNEVPCERERFVWGGE